MKPAASPPLAPKQSAAIREQLLSDIARVTQQDQAPEWARTALADKNRLTTEDAKFAEDAFAQRLAELAEAAPENAAEDPLPAPSARTALSHAPPASDD
jgi:hypothetical protein